MIHAGKVNPTAHCLQCGNNTLRVLLEGEALERSQMISVVQGETPSQAFQQAHKALKLFCFSKRKLRVDLNGKKYQVKFSERRRIRNKKGKVQRLIGRRTWVWTFPVKD